MTLQLPNTVFKTTVEVGTHAIELLQESVTGTEDKRDWVELHYADIKELIPIMQQFIKDYEYLQDGVQTHEQRILQDEMQEGWDG